MFVSVVIPCYRSARTLPELTARIHETLRNIVIEYEILLVVDGSPDETWNVAAELAVRTHQVRAIQLTRNYGQHNALLAGIRAARHDVIVTMDDDLQHPPEEIPRLLEALTTDTDLVYGLPRDEEHGVMRSLASRWVKATLSGVLAVDGARSLSAFRAFRVSLRDGLESVTGPNISIDVGLSWGTTRIAQQYVRMEPRTVGRSGYTLRSLARYALNLLIGYSSAPLRVVTCLGFLTGLLGLALLGTVLWMHLQGETTVAGFSTIASMVALFSSAQMLALGVLGEYIGRIHSAGMGRPAYVVRETTGSVEVPLITGTSH